MAQFVTHIQPTLVEASHHHPPHYYTHHRDHHKDCHIKDCFHRDCRHREHKDDREHHKDSHHKECTVKECHSKECHKDGHHKDAYHKECTVKNCQKECKDKDKKDKDKDKDKEKNKDKDKDKNKDKDKDKNKDKDNNGHEKESTKSPPLSEDSLKDTFSQSRKGSQGHYYTDSHGLKHEYDISFVDEQGIYRESEFRCQYDENQKEELRQKEMYESKFQSMQEVSKPTPPQYIDIQPVHAENKGVSNFFVSCCWAMNWFDDRKYPGVRCKVL